MIVLTFLSPRQIREAYCIGPPDVYYRIYVAHRFGGTSWGFSPRVVDGLVHRRRQSDTQDRRYGFLYVPDNVRIAGSRIPIPKRPHSVYPPESAHGADYLLIDPFRHIPHRTSDARRLRFRYPICPRRAIKYTASDSCVGAPVRR